MSTSQLEVNSNRKKQLGRFIEVLPKQGKQILEQIGETYADGAVDRKTKHLMAMAMALGLGCQNCVLFHTEAALEAGATRGRVS